MVKRECPTCANDYILLQGGRDHIRATRCTCQTPCPLCDDVGFTFRVDEQGYEVAEACRCRSVKWR